MGQAGNWAWDGGAAMTNQPVDVSVRPPKGPRRQMINGGWATVPLEKGAVIEATWVGTPAAMAELRTARNSQDEHSVAFDDQNGVSQSYDVHWEHDPAYSIGRGDHYLKITVELLERP